MTNSKEVEEGNIAILYFMGGSIMFDGSIHICSLGDNNKFHDGTTGRKSVDELQYHSSWDWLMPVVEKIEGLYDNSLMFIIKDTRAFIEINTQYAMAYDFHLPNEFYSGSCETKIAAAYDTCIQFINWYNQNNK